MAIFTNTVATDNTAGRQFYVWARPISAFMATAGWVQAADTGQVIWPVSIFNITDANGNGTTVTFTGTLTNGAALRVGMSIQVTGTTSFGTGAAPITYIINGGNLTTTFTAASATSAHDAAIAANKAWGSVNVQVSITNAIGNTSSNTFTYALVDGPDPINGQSIVVTGCTTAGFNATWIISSVNTGAKTFTTTTGITHSTEVETGTGIIACTRAVIAADASTTVTLPPAASNSVYEIWKMNDGNSFPVFLRINYGASATPAPALSVVLCAGTDGAGNPTGGSTGTQTVFSGPGVSASQASFMSGSSNRLSWALWASGTLQNGQGGFLNIERSHDSSGNDTSQYATLNVVGAVTNTSAIQISITTTNATVTETAWAAISSHTLNTGSFGLSTLLSPVFPIVGAVGNPMIGLLVGKQVDWTNNVQFPFTMYNVSHNYLILSTTSGFGAAGNLVYDATPRCAIAIRYE